MSPAEAGPQGRIEDMLSGGAKKAQGQRTPAGAKVAAPEGRRMFNGFRSDDIGRATSLASEFMKTVDDYEGTDGDALHAVMTKAEALNQTEPVGLVQHALSLFVTHHPQARKQVKLPSLEKRQPHLARSTAGTPAGATPPEDRVDYWREDPLLCDHHGHWHLVYPMSGRPVASGPPEFNDRHGELFAYMHEQMLARYDAERLGAGLARVTQLDDYRAPIFEGYDPGPLEIWDGEHWFAFRGRPSGAVMTDLTPAHDAEPGSLLDDMALHRDRLFEAARSGAFQIGDRKVPVTIENLGNAEESNNQSLDYYDADDPRNFMMYGAHHAVGHSHVMYFDNVEPMGVMGSFTTTPRDPAFWRWHKHVDAVFQTFQDRQEPHNFAEGPPATLLAIELTPSNDELLTEMVVRQLEVPDPQGTLYETIRYLSHDDFAYLVTAGNPSDTNLDVTMRLFLAPETQIEQRTAWIEMDRFSWTLKPGQNTIERGSDESSVIRKPVMRPSDLKPTDDAHFESDSQGWCDCGWPYTLLLPRGTANGMPFRLLGVLTSGDDLRPPDHCAPFSYYCGLENIDYPDKKPMGYPFDRGFRESISATVASHDSWLWRPVSIRCQNLESTAEPTTKVPPYHTTTSQEGLRAVYHDHSDCPAGQRIQPAHRAEGTGQRARCDDCERLD